MEFSEFATQKLLQATGQSEHLTDREKHLIGLAVTATRGCIACTGADSSELWKLAFLTRHLWQELISLPR